LAIKLFWNEASLVGSFITCVLPIITTQYPGRVILRSSVDVVVEK